jgi:hypothetical protein
MRDACPTRREVYCQHCTAYPHTTVNKWRKPKERVYDGIAYSLNSIYLASMGTFQIHKTHPREPQFLAEYHISVGQTIIVIGLIDYRSIFIDNSVAPNNARTEAWTEARTEIVHSKDLEV